MDRRTVLVIEDDKLNMKLVRTLLEQCRYAVIQAENAEEGIRLARSHHPDLILKDIQLPGMDGLRATRLIQREKCLSKIPVIALTAHAMRGDSMKALEAGVMDYITKPVDTRHS